MTNKTIIKFTLFLVAFYLFGCEQKETSANIHDGKEINVVFFKTRKEVFKQGEAIWMDEQNIGRFGKISCTDQYCISQMELRVDKIIPMDSKFEFSESPTISNPLKIISGFSSGGWGKNDTIDFIEVKAVRESHPVDTTLNDVLKSTRSELDNFSPESSK